MEPGYIITFMDKPKPNPHVVHPEELFRKQKIGVKKFGLTPNTGAFPNL
jgi:hypothetical protein